MRGSAARNTRHNPRSHKPKSARHKTPGHEQKPARHNPHGIQDSPGDAEAKTKLSNDDYTVGWICALPRELSASVATLDEVHCSLPNHALDTNAYTLGSVSGHNVVMACLDNYGTNKAAKVAYNMERSYPSIRFYLLVGVGGGVPGSGDVRLGDVVVGQAVVQHDLGKMTLKGHLRLAGPSWEPPSALMSSIAKLRANHGSEPSRIPVILNEMQAKFPSSTAWTTSRHGLQDWLYSSGYDHVTTRHETCDQCDKSKRIQRFSRIQDIPHVHYGTVASGNMVVKHGKERDKLVRTVQLAHGALPAVLCIEMEAAGLRDVPHMVIRGICDYADSHKNEQWQPYAAAAAAAYAKELLSIVPYNQQAPESHQDVLSNHKEDLLSSLAFAEIDSRIDDIRIAHAHTCEWLLSDTGYKDWLSRDQLSRHQGFLWVKGKPGAGKSTMMKFLVSHAMEGQIIPNAAIFTFFFHARGSRLEKTTTGMYRSLLFQLMKRFSSLQDILSNLPSKELETKGQRDGQQRWYLPTLRRLLIQAVARLDQQQPVIFFVDALDECDADEVREMIDDFERFTSAALRTGSPFYVCLASRHYPFIRLKACVEIVLEGKPGHTEDLESYARSKLSFSKGKYVQETIREITQKASGVFLWVVLVVQVLEKEIGKGRLHKLREKVRELPPDLKDLFREILLRDNEDMDALLLCIQWICFAERPMQPREFYSALMSTLDPTIINEWDEDFVLMGDMERFILGSSKGLAEVTKSGGKGRTVQFIHESVRDYLLKDNGLLELFPSLGPEFYYICQDQLKRSCQEYISVYLSQRKSTPLPRQRPQRKSGTRNKLLLRYPFLKYATSFIVSHANSAALAVDQADFLRDFDVDGWISLWKTVGGGNRSFGPSPSIYHVIASQNATNLLVAAIDLGSASALTKTKLEELFPTACASRNFELVKLILGYGTFVDAKDEEGLTGLIHATRNADSRIANLLIAKGASPESRDGNDSTPLHLASASGMEDTVRLLLEHSADHIALVESRDGVGSTPLHLASASGMKAIVRLLLDNGADHEVFDHSNTTPLDAAIRGSHDNVARTLLEAGASISRNLARKAYINYLQSTLEMIHAVDIPLSTYKVESRTFEPDRYSPLQWACYQGFQDSVEKCLEMGADVNGGSGCIGNPLHIACFIENRIEIADLLLQSKADPNHAGGKFGTPLLTACYAKNIKATLLLLDRGAHVNATTTEHGTPLQIACTGGSIKLVQLLLERGADVNAPGGKEGNALGAVLRSNGDMDIGRLLLDHGADSSVMNEDYHCALCYTRQTEWLDETIKKRWEEELLRRGVPDHHFLVLGECGGLLVVPLSEVYVTEVDSSRPRILFRGRPS